MSLINDALKRAGQSIRKRPPETPDPTTQMEPVPEPAPEKTPFSQSPPPKKTKPIVLLAVILIVGGAAWGGWTYWKGRTAASAPAQASQKTKPGTPSPAGAANVAKKTDPAKPGATPTASPGKATNVASAKTVPASDSTTPKAAPPKGSAPPDLAATPPAKSASPVAVATKSAASDLKLQAIFYRLSRPSAMINGQTLYVGDQIPGTAIKVKTIDRQSVVLDQSGQATTLTMR